MSQFGGCGDPEDDFLHPEVLVLMGFTPSGSLGFHHNQYCPDTDLTRAKHCYLRDAHIESSWGFLGGSSPHLALCHPKARVLSNTPLCVATCAKPAEPGSSCNACSHQGTHSSCRTLFLSGSLAILQLLLFYIWSKCWELRRLGWRNESIWSNESWMEQGRGIFCRDLTKSYWREMYLVKIKREF